MKKEREYENYHIPDLVADLRDDATSLKKKLELFEKLRRFLSVFTTVWSYMSIALFTVYGTIHLYRTGDAVLSSITFSVCGVFLVINTVLLVLRGRSRKDDRRYSTAKRVFRRISLALKIFMTAITIASLVGIADDPSIPLRVIWCVASVFWLGMTVAVDVAGFIVMRVLRMLKELAADRVRRTKAAFANSAADAVEIVRAVKDIGSDIKKIFAGRKKNDNKAFDDEEDFFAK